MPAGSFAGLSFAEVMRRMDSGVPVGIWHDHEMHMNPEGDMQVFENDRILAFAEESDSAVLREEGIVVPEDAEYVPVKPERTTETLVFGNRSTLKVVLRELPENVRKVTLVNWDHYNEEMIRSICAERDIILELADEGPCVIVGRCSDYILKDRKDAFHVFIHADPADRAERIINQYGVKTQDPARAVADEDKNRRKNYRYYTDREWGAVNNYTVSLNSSVFGIEGTAEMILNMVKSLNELPDQE
jgi:cytidylate kinase